jgi:hypothetical protein
MLGVVHARSLSWSTDKIEGDMRQPEGITTADTSAHGTTRSGTASSEDGARQPPLAHAICIHTEVLTLGRGGQVSGMATAPSLEGYQL